MYNFYAKLILNILTKKIRKFLSKNVSITSAQNMTQRAKYLNTPMFYTTPNSSKFVIESKLRNSAF